MGQQPPARRPGARRRHHRRPCQGGRRRRDPQRRHPDRHRPVPRRHPRAARDGLPEVAERWAQLTDAERKAIIDQKIEELAKEYGVDVEDIIWDDTISGNGSWSEDEKAVRLNPDRLSDPDLLHTVAHEMRHARQYEAIEDNNDFQFWWEDDPFDAHEEDGITEEQAEEWEENFDDYKSPDKDFDAYYNQPVEADARKSGREYLDNLTAAELDRLLKESK